MTLHTRHFRNGSCSINPLHWPSPPVVIPLSALCADQRVGTLGASREHSHPAFYCVFCPRSTGRLGSNPSVSLHYQLAENRTVRLRRRHTIESRVSVKVRLKHTENVNYIFKIIKDGRSCCL